MSDVAGISGTEGASRAQHAAPAGRAEPGRSEAGRVRRDGDRVELSQGARELQSRQGLREELIVQVREQIEAGEYDTPERMEEALDRLIDEIV